jgi:nitrate reductase delta subunit
MKTFRVLSALLNYPTQELQAAADELHEAIRDDNLLPAAVRRHLDALIDDIAVGDLYDLQERYVLLFDRTRSLSLHLFEHVHGESRDRGQAMIDLNALYEKNGLFISAGELPDFLPLFLEYLSTQPFPEARQTLGQTVHILSALAERLRKRQSPYEAAFRALVATAAVKPTAEALAALLDEPSPDPTDLAALDEAWADEPVTFGPAASSCKDGIIARIRAGRRSAPAPAAPEA